MFDAQKYPFADNLAWTREYVEAYGDQVMVEGIIEELAIEGKVHAVQQDDYVAKAVRFMHETGVDLLVADMGTEQNAAHVGGATYLKARGEALTASLGGVAKLVLHGTSCLSIICGRALCARRGRQPPQISWRARRRLMPGTWRRLNRTSTLKIPRCAPPRLCWK